MANELSAVIFDAEIKKCIPPKNGQLTIGVDYCKGWEDFAGMSIATLCAWDCMTNKPLVFMDDNLQDFKKLIVSRRLFVGFNNRKFDDQLLDANGIEIPHHKSFDLLRAIWEASGLNPDEYNYKTHGGFSLDAMCRANFSIGKSGDGALAPILWQQGEIGKLASYCLDDVMLTRQLFMRAYTQSALKCPKTGELLTIAIPTI